MAMAGANGSDIRRGSPSEANHSRRLRFTQQINDEQRHAEDVGVAREFFELSRGWIRLPHAVEDKAGVEESVDVGRKRAVRVADLPAAHLHRTPGFIEIV